MELSVCVQFLSHLIIMFPACLFGLNSRKVILNAFILEIFQLTQFDEVTGADNSMIPWRYPQLFVLLCWSFAFAKVTLNFLIYLSHLLAVYCKQKVHDYNMHIGVT